MIFSLIYLQIGTLCIEFIKRDAKYLQLVWRGINKRSFGSNWLKEIWAWLARGCESLEGFSIYIGVYLGKNFS